MSFLNELRFRRDTALRLRLPLSTEELPAAAAAGGRQGPFEGRDYRGVPVLSVIRSIPGTTWSMIAKIDSEEIYAPLREETRTIMAFVLLLIGAAGIGLAYVWKVQTSRFFLQRYEEEKELRVALLASERERDLTIAKLREALAQVKALSGTAPDLRLVQKDPRTTRVTGSSSSSYIREHSEARFSHSFCPGACVERLYPGLLKPSAPKSGAAPAVPPGGGTG